MSAFFPMGPMAPPTPTSGRGAAPNSRTGPEGAAPPIDPSVLAALISTHEGDPRLRAVGDFSELLLALSGRTEITAFSETTSPEETSSAPEETDVATPASVPEVAVAPDAAIAPDAVHGPIPPIPAGRRDMNDVHPELRGRVERVIERMWTEFGHHAEVIEGYRPQARQDALHAQGRTAPGPVVTWTRDSAHTRGEAVDLIIDGGWDDLRGFERLQQIAREEGLRTLGMRDPGHLELPSSDGTWSPGHHHGDAEEPEAAASRRPRGSVATVARVARVARPGVPAPGSSAIDGRTATRPATNVAASTSAQSATIAGNGGSIDLPAAERATTILLSHAAAGGGSPGGASTGIERPGPDLSRIEIPRTAIPGIASGSVTIPHLSAQVPTLPANLVDGMPRVMDRAATPAAPAIAPSAPTDTAAENAARIAPTTTAEAARESAENESSGEGSGHGGGRREGGSSMERRTPSRDFRPFPGIAQVPPATGNGAPLQGTGALLAGGETTAPSTLFRAEQLRAIQQAGGARGNLAVELTNVDGAGTDLHLGMRGRSVAARIDSTDPLRARALQLHLGELRSSLLERGLEPDRLGVRWVDADTAPAKESERSHAGGTSDDSSREGAEQEGRGGRRDHGGAEREDSESRSFSQFFRQEER